MEEDVGDWLVDASSDTDQGPMEAQGEDALSVWWCLDKSKSPPCRTRTKVPTRMQPLQHTEEIDTPRAALAGH
ncbi:hypothetical protein H257_17366 [Aphanomyces astaci]|uniref:Uncharacterized protein n=1 Tax=Aphanomyces astaci TaxID=112090 RepID=W4FGY4_APHAT|nr:hypothetical protein H257_17366 [Aphanomyces astaci]ETV66018.1 hypothetical protein H257_17366 [Aphanomyces astaci]|eukprot:XP_009844447.1 hypothetical protein H257_17366 [Aphanomyces astaci]